MSNAVIVLSSGCCLQCKWQIVSGDVFAAAKQHTDEAGHRTTAALSVMHTTEYVPEEVRDEEQKEG